MKYLILKYIPLLHFILYVQVFFFHHMYVWAPCTSVVPSEVRTHWIPWNWSYREFQAVLWFLGTEPMSSVRAVGAETSLLPQNVCWMTVWSSVCWSCVHRGQREREGQREERWGEGKGKVEEGSGRGRGGVVEFYSKNKGRPMKGLQTKGSMIFF